MSRFEVLLPPFMQHLLGRGRRKHQTSLPVPPFATFVSFCLNKNQQHGSTTITTRFLRGAQKFHQKPKH